MRTFCPRYHSKEDIIPSFKDKLIAEYGPDKAAEILSERMREARSKVKKPTGLASKSKAERSKIAQKGWETRKRENRNTAPPNPAK